MDPFPKKDEEIILIPCKICGRKFKEDALLKHEPVCDSIFQGKKEVGLSIEDKHKQSEQKIEDNKRTSALRAENIKQSDELRSVIMAKRNQRKLEGDSKFLLKYNPFL